MGRFLAAIYDRFQQPLEEACLSGWRADLLVVNGDPLRDIAAVADRANHRCVYKDGRVAAARADPDSCGPLALVTPSVHHRP